MMKRLLRKAAALTVALALLCALTLPAWAAQGAVYLLAVDDYMADLPGGLLPEPVYGSIYVPYSAFDKVSTGVDLGVSYSLERVNDNPVLTLYSTTDSKQLTFNVIMGECVDQTGAKKDFRAYKRNLVVYVPAKAVCSFFGLQYSFLPTTDRGTLIRLSGPDANISDAQFLSVAADGMARRYGDITKGQEPSGGQGQTGTPPTVTQAPGSATPDRKSVYTYLAVRGTDGVMNGVSGTLRSYGAKGLFLFTPDELPQNAAYVRQLVAQGHSIGLTVTGTAAEAEEQLARGNELLAHIARVRTRVAEAPSGIRESLARDGWVCWSANVSGSTTDRLLKDLDGISGQARLQLPSSVSQVEKIMKQLREDKYTLRPPLETELG